MATLLFWVPLATLVLLLLAEWYRYWRQARFIKRTILEAFSDSWRFTSRVGRRTFPTDSQYAELAMEVCNLLAHHHDPWWKMDETTRMCVLCRDSKVFEKMESLGLKFTGRSPDENCPPSRNTSGLVPLPQSPYSVIEGSLKKIELEDGFVSLRMTGPSLPTLGIPMIIPDGPPKHEWIEQYTWALNSAFNVGVQASERRS